MVVKISGLYKQYGRGTSSVAALKAVNLDVSQGEIMAIMGPSGSGKSTLMNIIGFLDRPSKGIYEFNGRRVDRLNDNQLAVLRNKHMGFVFQNFNLLPRYTALANVEIPLIYSGVPAKKRRRIAEELLEVVGLKERMFHRSNELSGGQKQRVAIARALVNHPSIILADEPTGNLDSKSGTEIMKLFGTLNAIGVTIILVTHDREIANYANRVVVIKDGEIVSDNNIQRDNVKKQWIATQRTREPLGVQ